MDDAVEIEGYDWIDDNPSYSPSPGRRNTPSPGRKGRKINLSAHAPRGGRRSRPLGRTFRLNIDPRELAGAVSSMLVIAVVGIIAIASILYYTFTTFKAGDPMLFYGALAASMVFVLLLACAGIKLLGIDD